MHCAFSGGVVGGGHHLIVHGHCSGNVTLRLSVSTDSLTHPILYNSVDLLDHLDRHSVNMSMGDDDVRNFLLNVMDNSTQTARAQSLLLQSGASARRQLEAEAAMMAIASKTAPMAFGVHTHLASCSLCVGFREPLSLNETHSTDAVLLRLTFSFRADGSIDSLLKDSRLKIEDVLFLVRGFVQDEVALARGGFTHPDPHPGNLLYVFEGDALQVRWSDFGGSSLAYASAECQSEGILHWQQMSNDTLDTFIRAGLGLVSGCEECSGIVGLLQTWRRAVQNMMKPMTAQDYFGSLHAAFETAWEQALLPAGLVKKVEAALAPTATALRRAVSMLAEENHNLTKTVDNLTASVHMLVELLSAAGKLTAEEAAAVLGGRK